MSARTGCINRKKCFFCFKSLRLSLIFVFSHNDATKKAKNSGEKTIAPEWASTIKTHLILFFVNRLQKRSNTESLQGKKCNSGGFFFYFLKCVQGFRLSVCRFAFFFVVFRSTTYTPWRMRHDENSHIACRNMFTSTRVQTPTRNWCSAFARARRLQISSLYIRSRAHKHQTWAKQHKLTQTMKRVRVRSHRRRCELFCPEKLVPLVALSSQHACCTVAATHSLESSSLAFVSCVHLRPSSTSKYVRRSEMWTWFFSSSSFSIAMERYAAFVLHEK